MSKYVLNEKIERVLMTLKSNWGAASLQGKICERWEIGKRSKNKEDQKKKQHKYLADLKQNQKHYSKFKDKCYHIDWKILRKILNLKLKLPKFVKKYYPNLIKCYTMSWTNLRNKDKILNIKK